MKITDFTENKIVIGVLEKLKKDKIDKKIFSDIIDNNGNQYIDLVMEGGGMLGIALVGYTYVLESIGIKFLGIAGTSAGAINAIILAAHGEIDSVKSTYCLDLISNKNFYDFVDGGNASKNLIKSFINKENAFITGFWGILESKDFLSKMGLNSGNNFYDWLSDILKQNDADTTEKLLKKREKLPSGIQHRNGTNISNEKIAKRLSFIASEITTQSKMDFPKMANLIWDNPDTTNPANYIRASMSIPFFFEPFQIENIPNNDNSKDNWNNFVDYNGTLPNNVVMIDGGIMSNFPIDIFHVNSVPRLPTFGIRLSSDRKTPKKIKNVIDLSMAMFDGARHIHDIDFIEKNKDYEKLISYINTGTQNWLDFDMSDENKIELFISGVISADNFLRKFDWENYKIIRKNLITENVEG